jgi:hypothetical protein
MELTNLIVIASLILSLSIASERLVEIIKGFFPCLDKAKDDPAAEARRRAYLQILAVLSGMLTAYLASDFVPEAIAKASKGLAIIGLGLLASGGSGLWNSVLSYLIQVKEIKKIDFETAKRTFKAQDET